MLMIVSSGAKGLNFGLIIGLHFVFVHGSSAGSPEPSLLTIAILKYQSGVPANNTITLYKPSFFSSAYSAAYSV